MKIPKRPLALVAAGGLLAFGLVTVSASPSFASGGGCPTGGYGGSCPGSAPQQIQGTLTVSSVIAYTTDAQAFFLDSGTIGQFTAGYNVAVSSNDGVGVSVYLSGPPGGQFGATNGSGIELNDGFVSAATIGSISGTGSGTAGACSNSITANEQATSLQAGGGQFTLVDDQPAGGLTGHLTCGTGTTPAGWDSFHFGGFELNSAVTGVPAGTYTGALTMAEFGD